MKTVLMTLVKALFATHICFDLAFGFDSPGSRITIIIALLLAVIIYVLEKKEKKGGSSNDS